MNEIASTCSVCPRLCRPACPVAVGTGREAATPTAIAGVLVDHQRGHADAALVADALALCVDCGRCQDHCHLHQPLPELLRVARIAHLTPPPPEPLGVVPDGAGDVVVETDERPLAAAVAFRLGRPTRAVRTADGLGGHAVGYPAFDEHAARLRAAFGGVTVWTAHGGVRDALRAAGVDTRDVAELLDDAPPATCGVGVPGCCGARGPIVWAAPDDARLVAASYLAHGGARSLRDARCASHLRALAPDVRDVVDRLTEA
jgi:Fe-S oxidoreductase